MSAEVTRPGPAEPSGFATDLLVMGYLSAVAQELDRRRVAECRLRMSPLDQSRLSGSLDLEVIGRTSSRRPWGTPTTARWDEAYGWSATLRAAADSSPPARRHLCASVVAAPSTVADFIAELVVCRDAGMPYPCRASCTAPTQPGRARMLAELGRHTFPEVQRWLRSEH
jgi:hypothetical protein